MNQFGSMYGQVLCCGGCGDFKDEKCLNGTQQHLNNALSGGGKYAWICAVIGLLGLISLLVFGMFFYIKKKT